MVKSLFLSLMFVGILIGATAYGDEAPNDVLADLIGNKTFSGHSGFFRSDCTIAVTPQSTPELGDVFLLSVEGRTFSDKYGDGDALLFWERPTRRLLHSANGQHWVELSRWASRPGGPDAGDFMVRFVLNFEPLPWGDGYQINEAYVVRGRSSSVVYCKHLREEHAGG